MPLVTYASILGAFDEEVPRTMTQICDSLAPNDWTGQRTVVRNISRFLHSQGLIQCHTGRPPTFTRTQPDDNPTGEGNDE